MIVALDQPTAPRVKRWTKGEYINLIEHGAFQGQHVYLLRGELIEMPPMGALHARTLTKGYTAIFRLLDPTYVIRVQMPFEVPGNSMPEPDVGVFTEQAAEQLPHPKTALLLVEVSDSSVNLDHEKASEYAAAGMPEYWIVDVLARQIEIYRQPIDYPSADLGFRYASHKIYGANETISPQIKPSISITIADLLT